MMGQSNISDIEYFFDSDPGVGNATNVQVTSTTTLNENISISINALSSGVHILHMRSKNDANKWSFYSRQTFYIANFSATLNNTITEAEYFIDTDPGVGNATTLNITSTSNLDTSFAIPLNSVPTGIHILHIRIKNNLNQWSLYTRQVFYKSPQILGNEVVAAEYFIDTDPGIGNAEVLSISQGVLLNEFLSIPLTSVSEGIHILHIRVKNNMNQWSLYARQVFYKSPQILGNEIVAAEYFIDTDPGIGNATSVALTQGTLVDEILNIAIPNDLSVGDHVLHIRVLSSNGNWSLYGRPEFTSTLSNNDMVFENFKMYPNPVEDILHFSMGNNQMESLTLIDINGKKIIELTENSNQLNLSKIPSGLYLLQIKTENGSISKKIIKK
jgi:hypothetical protein